MWGDGPAGRHTLSRGDSQFPGGWGERKPNVPVGRPVLENLDNDGHPLGYSCDHLCGQCGHFQRDLLTAGAQSCLQGPGEPPCHSGCASHMEESMESHGRRRVLTADPKGCSNSAVVAEMSLAIWWLSLCTPSVGAQGRSRVRILHGTQCGQMKRIVITVFFWRLEVKCLEQREPFSLTCTKALMGERPLTSTGAGPIQPSVQVTAVLLRGMTPETGQRAAAGL